MKDADKFLEMLEQFIEAVMADKNSDHVQDRLYRNQIRADFLTFLKDEA